MSPATAAATREEPVRILVVDDEPVVQDVLGRVLTRAGYRPLFASTAGEGRALMASEKPDLVILDVMLPDRNGLELLQEFKKSDPESLVIMMTAHGSVENAVEAMKQGAFHYVTKPFSNDEVLLLVEKALDNRRLREENRLLRSLLSGEGRFEGLVGRSKEIEAVFRMVEQVANSRSTVLILGESGTGKELIARAIHARSPRAKAPFLTVNSGSIPPDLMESNLFGHVKGAFTGAISSREGLFRAADTGTVFFDEIGTLVPELQVKLLRVMQEKSFMPVGSTESVSVDVRILAATNVDLMAMVQRGDFREDLYYRLNVLKVQLPPLRERRDDIRLLADHFLKKYALEHDKPLTGIDAEAMEVMLGYSWPGNVRELENAIIRGVVLATGPTLGVADLAAEIGEGGTDGERTESNAGVPLPDAVSLYEKRLIRGALERSGGVQRQAARLLGIKPTTLNEKMKRLGLKPAR